MKKTMKTFEEKKLKEFEEWYEANTGIKSLPRKERISVFLLQTLAEQKEEIMRRLPKEIFNEGYDVLNHFNEGYNKAIRDFKNNLTNYE